MARATSTVVVLTTYPSADASRRLRIDPIVQTLRTMGHRVHVDTILSDFAYENKRARQWWRRAWVILLLVVGLLRRLIMVAICFRRPVLIHREAFPLWTPLVERTVSRLARLVVLDFDDSLWSEPDHGKDWRRLLRNPSRFDDVIKSADHVSVGSPVLADRSRLLSSSVELNLTCPPLYDFGNRQSPISVERMLWIGSDTSIEQLWCFRYLLEDFAKSQRSEVIVLSGPSSMRMSWPSRFRVGPWSPEHERELLGDSVLGIMPLKDSPWAAGKCSYKLLQYMSAGLPHVSSPIGMNNWLVQQSGSGFSAADDDQWRRHLSAIYGSPNLAHELGSRGRAWVETHAKTADVSSRLVKQLVG